MKQLLYSLHSKWSLFLALFSLRLWDFEEGLEFMCEWHNSLGLPDNDSLAFFPYIVSIGGIRFVPTDLSLGIQKIFGIRERIVKDPVNIIAHGVAPKEFIALLQDTNPRWEQFLGSSYFLHGSASYKWHASIAIKLDIDAQTQERHHIRLFGLTTKNGQKITLGAAHHDWPNHTEQAAPTSWNETRDLVAEDLDRLAKSSPKHSPVLWGLSKEVAEQNWRGATGDGRILVINALNRK